MKKIVSVIFIALFFSALSHSQTETNDPVTIDKRNIQFFLKDKVSYYLDSTRRVSFKDIKKLPFKTLPTPWLDYQSKTWYKFYINTDLESKTLIFSPGHTDSTNVYVPYKKAYKKFTIGRLTKTVVDFSIYDASILYIPIDSVDFNKPFYYNKVLLTRTGKLSANSSGYVVLANNTLIWKSKKNKAIGYTLNTHVFLGILCIAMLMFFVNYLVTKDKNYLNYSFYLFFTILIFSSRVLFLVNFLNSISPILIDCLSHASIIMASVSYFYFVITFLDIKNQHRKIYPLAKYTVIISLVIAAFSIIQLIFLPYLKYRYAILSIYDVTFVVISITTFIYLITKRLTLIDRIVIFGSFLLIIGQVLSLLTSNAYYFIGAVILEIIAFSSVVSFQNKITSYNRLLIENALQKEKAERKNLQDLDKLKSRFITNITHEFRTPLTIIQGNIDNLNEEYNDDTKVTETLNTIKQSSNNLLDLVNQMLDLDALENKKLSINLVQSDIVGSTSKIVNNLRSMALDKAIQIHFKASPNEIIMDFDFEKLRQILSNLISNAIKFSPENSELKINLKKIKNHTLQIQVKDKGYGIAKENLPFIFNRFYQVESDTQKVYQGTGIGLALAKELVGLLNGSIKVNSTLGKGSTFTISLPITNSANKNTFNSFAEKSINFEETKNNNPNNEVSLNTVLIVEDHTDMSNFISSCLELDYNILLAKNGKKGLEIAEDQIPDIIVTDVMMPLLDGFELTQKLQTNPKTNHIPIIVLTAKSEHQDKLAGISSGADAYLTKPFEKDELKLRVQMLISKRRQLQKRYKVNAIIKTKDKSETTSDKNLIFLNSIIDIIHNHIDDVSFDAKKLARTMAMSDSQLYRKLKAISNTSTSIFIRKVRLEKAKELLTNVDLSISEIAYATGFNDPNWFSKAFKAEFDISPSDYRN